MSRIVAEYIDFLYSELGPEEAEKLLAAPPGVVLLRNSKNLNLFDHPHVRLWHRFLIERFEPEPKPLALILPCTGVKPYRLSPTHCIAAARLRNLGIAEDVSVYIMSEPMILVPQELDIYYPFANYDYPPRELGTRERELFIELLSHVLTKLRRHRFIVATLPRHHASILLDTMNRLGSDPSIMLVPYGRKAFSSIARAVDMLWSLASRAKEPR